MQNINMLLNIKVAPVCIDFVGANRFQDALPKVPGKPNVVAASLRDGDTTSHVEPDLCQDKPSPDPRDAILRASSAKGGPGHRQ